MHRRTLVLLMLAFALVGCLLAAQKPDGGGASRVRKSATDPFLAASRGDLASLKTLIERDKGILTKVDGNGRTLLHHAAQHDEIEVTDYLVRAGLEIDRRDDSGYTPLHVAALAGRIKAAKALIALGADSGARRETPRLKALGKGFSVLDIAAFRGDVELVELLLSKGCSIIETKIPDPRSAIHEACTGLMGPEYLEKEEYAGNRKVITVLMKKVKDVNVRQYDMRTPLHVAAEFAAVDTVSFLLDTYESIDVNAKDVFGNTPLHLAVQDSAVKVSSESRAKVISMLLKKGAKTTMKNSKGRTPLDDAKATGDGILIQAFGR